ncbi:uncharacterized protein LOC118193709 [Stegodyphus dumicola]|uniref:uncharacterized protein LOC118193709 n=1 Tax=Stegodyphus dumicola TaxID=202533 RepID=UPI0015AB1060|nr:uncharacterized protein LOC118193709 [Stegodyphus dumicola]
MSEIRNYGSVTADSEQNRRESSEDGQFRRYHERNWKLLGYYCAIIGFAVLAFLCIVGILRIMLDDTPLPGKLAMFLIGTPFIVLCCFLSALSAISLRKLTAGDSLEEQQPSTLETQVQNPDSSLETERLLTSSPKIGARNPDLLRQATSNPEVGVRNPDSSLETERLLTRSPKIGAQNPDSLRQATSNPEVGVRNQDSLRQTEELGTSKPEIGLQNPDSLHETEGLGTGNLDIGVQMPGSWP